MSTRRRKTKQEGSDGEKTARITSEKEKPESSNGPNQKTKEVLQALKEKQAKSEGQERSKEPLEESSGNQSTAKKRGSSRLRDLSQRVQKSFLRTFVSRPVQQAQLMKFVNKVEKREETRNKNAERRELRMGDTTFHRVGSGKSFNKKNITDKEDVVQEKTDKKRSKKDVKKMSFLENGDPFWLGEKEVRNNVEDHLPLNADVVIKVLEGKVDLEEMPRVPVMLDPYNEQSEITKRDKLFFNRPVLFGNTMRSMINITEESYRARHKKKPKGSPKQDLAQFPFEEPKNMKLYDRKDVVATLQETERKTSKFGNTRDANTAKLREPFLLPGAEAVLVESFPGKKKKDPSDHSAKPVTTQGTSAESNHDVKSPSADATKPEEEKDDGYY